MKATCTLVLTLLWVVGFAGSTMAQTEDHEPVEVRDCHAAMVWAARNPLARAFPKFVTKPTRVDPAPMSPERLIVLEYSATLSSTTFVRFKWPNMSVAETEANTRHLPAQREHELGHHNIAKEVISEFNRSAPKYSGAGDMPAARAADLQTKIDAYERTVKAEEHKRQVEYDIKTDYGRNQQAVSGTNVAYSCGSQAAVVAEAYTIEVSALSYVLGSASVDLEATNVFYDASAVADSLNPLIAALPYTSSLETSRAARPIITRSRSGRRDPLEEKGPLRAIGEDIAEEYSVRVTGGGSAKAVLALRYRTQDGRFVADGEMTLRPTKVGGGRSGQAISRALLKFVLAIVEPSSVEVVNCEIFDRETMRLFAEPGSFSEDGGTCRFRMGGLSLAAPISGYLVSFDIDGTASQSEPPIENSGDPTTFGGNFSVVVSKVR